MISSNRPVYVAGLSGVRPMGLWSILMILSDTHTVHASHFATELRMVGALPASVLYSTC